MDIARDAEGFLVNRDDWQEAVAAQMTSDEGYEMNDDILLYIKTARGMYDEEGVVPPIRKFSKKAGADSKHLYEVLKRGPMKPIYQCRGLRMVNTKYSSLHRVSE